MSIPMYLQSTVQQPTAPTPAEALALARSTCRELRALLLEENANLHKFSTDKAEQRLQDKKRLTLRLEQLFGLIKQTRPVWQADRKLAAEANLLAEELQHFQELAHRNEILLQAAHRLRADLVLTIRDAVQSTQPQPLLYGANGYMAASRPTGSLVMREI